MTSRSDITCDLGRAMTGTNLKENCAYFESKKSALYLFPALLRLRVVVYRYPTTRNKKKKFRVICTLNNGFRYRLLRTFKGSHTRMPLVSFSFRIASCAFSM